MADTIASYRVLIYGSAQTRSEGALILLFDAKGETLARVVFFRDLADANPADHGLPDGAIEMHMPMSEFQSTLDVLRNEGPSSVFLNTPQSGDPYVQITTGLEPAGEGEL